MHGMHLYQKICFSDMRVREYTPLFSENSAFDASHVCGLLFPSHKLLLQSDFVKNCMVNQIL